MCHFWRWSPNSCETIKDELVKRFQLKDDGTPDVVTSPTCVAMLLDPRYKTMKILQEEEQENLISFVADLLPDEVESQVCPKQEAVSGDSDQASSSNILDCLLGDVEIDLTSASKVTASEVKQYLQ